MKCFITARFRINDLKLFRRSYSVNRLLNLRLSSSSNKYLTTSTKYLSQLDFRVDLHKYLTAVQKDFKSKFDRFKESNIESERTYLQRTQPLVELIEGIQKINEELAQLKIFLSDIKPDEKTKDVEDMVREEEENYHSQLFALETQAIDAILPEEAIDNMDIIMELSAGVGGQEAMLFTQDMFHMYSNYAQYKNWTCEILEYNQTDINGLRHATLSITGPLACKYLKFEGGVHRVQRVPKTEKSGRIHTSTMTVAVLPQPSEIQININPKDLTIETMRASGAGGQHVNKTESAVRITHVPSGLVAECQMSRSQHENMKLAMATLRARLYDRVHKADQIKIMSARKVQVGSAARSDKVRTYNYVQDRITDHRISENYHNMPEFLSGGKNLNCLIEQLLEESRKELLNEILQNFLSEHK